MEVSSVRLEKLPAFVDCRYRAAVECVRSGKQLRRNQSDTIAYASTVLLRNRSLRESGRNRAPLANDPHLLRAYEIFEGSDLEKVAKIEACLLSPLSCIEIANRVGEVHEVIELFSKCFFDVRTGTGEEALKLVVDAFQDVPSNQLVYRYLWKRVALSGDLSALDALMSPPRICTMADMVQNAVSEAREIALHKVALAVKNHDIGDTAAVGELRQMLDEMRAAQPDDTHDYLLQQIGGIFTSLGFSVGERQSESFTPEELEFQNSAVELSGLETQRMAFGFPVEHQEALLAVRFPEHLEPFPMYPVEEQPDRLQVEAQAPSPSPMEPLVTTSPEVQSPSPNDHDCIMQRVEQHQESIQAKHDALLEEERHVAGVAQNLELHRRDLEWERESLGLTGGRLHRLRLKFAKKYPGYHPPDVREVMKKAPRG